MNNKGTSSVDLAVIITVLAICSALSLPIWISYIAGHYQSAGKKLSSQNMERGNFMFLPMSESVVTPAKEVLTPDVFDTDTFGLKKASRVSERVYYPGRTTGTTWADTAIRETGSAHGRTIRTTQQVDRQISVRENTLPL